MRRKAREIESAGVEVLDVRAGDAESAITDLLALHRQQWRGRGMTPEHGRSRFGRHLADATSAMIKRGQAEIISFHRGGRVVAVELLVVGHSMVGGYLFGVDPELRRLVDVAQLRLGPSLALTRRLGRPVLSFLRGDEPYKRVWEPTERRSQRLILAGRSTVESHMYAAAVYARYRLVQVVRERAPWLRTTLQRVARWRQSVSTMPLRR